MVQLAGFLGVHTGPWRNRKMPLSNTQSNPYKIRVIDCATHRALQAFFEPQDRRLYALLNSCRKEMPSQNPRFSGVREWEK